MKNNLKANLIALYQDYGFELKQNYDSDKVLVFGFSGGYFRNVDIVPYSENSVLDNAYNEFQSMGFACQKRRFRQYDAVDKELFEGFFSLQNNKKRLDNEYAKFASSVVRMYGNEAKYKYLNSPYYFDDVLGEDGLVEEIYSKLDEDYPVLFLVEAAAGFGKTCAAYEIARKINQESYKIPFFAELSRNRQARIFKHVLLDEIDRVFPSLSSRLVEREINNGRIVTILDGFDELLRDGDDEGEFENKEPMLETIGHYLRGAAKIVLTTRKTMLFDGDRFFDWVQENVGEFQLIRLRLGEPRIRDWLDTDRYTKLTQVVGNELDNISNPVLLSYLRCVPDEMFEEICQDSSGLVNSYFNFMLEREKTRQDLALDIDEQHEVLEKVAFDMIELDYFSEERDYIVDFIMESCSSIIDRMIRRYPIENRPKREEIANKLASHALLDRSSRSPNKIGFINDFVFGNYISRNVIKADEWHYDKWVFLEPSVLSYRHRSKDERARLYHALSEVFPYLSPSNQVVIQTELERDFCIALENCQIESIDFDEIKLGDNSLCNVNFIGCVFNKCIFDFSKMTDVTFLSCQFYGCSVEASVDNIVKVHFLSSDGDGEFLDTVFSLISRSEVDNNGDCEISLESAEKAVLERFWPVGRDSITYKHRPIRGICNNYGGHTPAQLHDAICSLKKRNVLKEPKSASFVEINFDMLVEIKRVLGR
jgi:hypothetical protein